MQWRHQQELAEVKRNADLLMMELRQTMEAEKQKTLSDFKKQADIEKHKAVAETKKKQWCAHCGKEAIFYCCWNTSYCDYPCQVSKTIICTLDQKMTKNLFYSKLTGPPICRHVLKTNLTKMKMDLVRMPTKETVIMRLPLSISFQLLNLVTEQLPEPMVYQLNQPGACRYLKRNYFTS